MITVECNECPIRNFCKQLEADRECNNLVDDKVKYHHCPLVELSEEKAEQ